MTAIPKNSDERAVRGSESLSFVKTPEVNRKYTAAVIAANPAEIAAS